MENPISESAVQSEQNEQEAPVIPLTPSDIYVDTDSVFGVMHERSMLRLELEKVRAERDDLQGATDDLTKVLTHTLKRQEDITATLTAAQNEATRLMEEARKLRRVARASFFVKGLLTNNGSADEMYSALSELQQALDAAGITE